MNLIHDSMAHDSDGSSKSLTFILTD